MLARLKFASVWRPIGSQVQRHELIWAAGLALAAELARSHALAASSQGPDGLAAVAAAASPAVVSVVAERRVSQPAEDDGWLDRLLGTSASEPAYETQALGAGIVVRAAGSIVTTAHLVNAADRIRVRVADGRWHVATLVGADHDADVAVIAIDVRELPTLPPANSDDVLLGEPVVAIGDPLGFSRSVTAGVVSAISRADDAASNRGAIELIQTDAELARGSSGGALVNIRGELLGMVAVVRGTVAPAGYAIPAGRVLAVVDRLLDAANRSTAAR